MTGATTLSQRPLVIAHRGASAERPEHTLTGYALAIAQGADFIEPDLVSTSDGVLVARHENEISTTTDVADHAEFADRHTRKTIDGHDISGWFTEDFTLAELKSLKARERLPLLRPANRMWNDRDSIPTFAEILTLVRDSEKRLGRRIGIYPETKHPGHFRRIGLPLEPVLLQQLAQYGYGSAGDAIFIQSFEVGNLQALRQQTRLPLVQLAEQKGGPADQPGTLYADMLTPAGLAHIASYADAIGVERDLVLAGHGLHAGRPTGLVEAAHRAGLKVHVWTFRPENVFLGRHFRKGLNPAGHGDLVGEIRAFAAAGIDGLFSNSTAIAVAALAE